MQRINCEMWDAQVSVFRTQRKGESLESLKPLMALASSMHNDSRKARKAEKAEAVEAFLRTLEMPKAESAEWGW